MKNRSIKNFNNTPISDIRISKLVSNYGGYSRRETDKLISAGRVKKNGIVAVLGQRAKVTDKIEIDNKKVNFNLKNNYFLLNKPTGYICSKIDKKGKPAISLIRNFEERNLFTIGRLDVNTSGLIIVTNDGDLSELVNKPSNKIKKVYLVWLDSKLSPEDIRRIKIGVVLDDGYETRPISKLKVIYNDDDKVFFKITIIEGKKNQIRRMFKSIDKNVINLKRVSIGDILLEPIGLGEYKKIDKVTIYNLLGL